MSQQWKSEAGGEEDVQMPLGTGGGGEAPVEEYSAPSKSKINGGTIALVIAFAAGLTVLYFLGLGNKPKTASAEQMHQDQVVSDKIQQLLGNKDEQRSLDQFLKESGLLMTRLKRYFEIATSKTNELPVNPFEHEVLAVSEVGPKPPGDPGPVGPKPEDVAVAAELRKAAEYYATLKLQMVMVGTPSIAMINNRMVSVGNQLEMFTVSDIKADGVTLSLPKFDRQFLLTQVKPGAK